MRVHVEVFVTNLNGFVYLVICHIPVPTKYLDVEVGIGFFVAEVDVAV